MRRTLGMRRRRRKDLNDISLTPIIDVALTLLVIFIMTAPAIQNAIRVTLPRGDIKEDTGIKQDVVVTINEHKHLFVNGQPISPQDIIATIEQAVTKGIHKTVHVKADTGVSYGTVVELVDTIKKIPGVSYVALATERRAQDLHSLA